MSLDDGTEAHVAAFFKANVMFRRLFVLSPTLCKTVAEVAADFLIRAIVVG